MRKGNELEVNPGCVFSPDTPTPERNQEGSPLYWTVVDLLKGYLDKKQAGFDQNSPLANVTPFPLAIQALQEIISYLKKEQSWNEELNVNHKVGGFLGEAMAYVILSLICGRNNVVVVPLVQEWKIEGCPDLIIPNINLN